nr:RecName: Full=Potassium channel toxin alpha-KTx 6 OcyKTx4 [Opisthacanthus cayaporum]
IRCTGSKECYSPSY